MRNLHSFSSNDCEPRGRAVQFTLMTAVCAAALVLAGCAAQTPAAPTATATQPPPAATATQQPTPTLEPTATATLPPTATPEPTATPLPPLAVTEDALSGWCLPDTLTLPAGYDPQAGVMLEGANPMAKDENGAPRFTYPARSCTILVAFNQAAPSGLKLELYDGNAAPWLTADMIPLPDDPTRAAATLTHSYVVNPPLWNIQYKLVVRGADDTAYLEETATFARNWQIERCWNGTYPDVDIQSCPKVQDLHPWDPGYGWFDPVAWDELHGDSSK